MAVTATTTSVSYAANGSTSSFPVPFKFMASSDLLVTRTVAGVVSSYVLGSHYSVAGAGVDAGGSVDFFDFPVSGTTVTITRSTAATQPSSLQTQGAFSSKVHETALDRAALVEQETQASLVAVTARLTSLETTVANGGGGSGGTGSTTSLTLLDSATAIGAAGKFVLRSTAGKAQLSENGGGFHDVFPERTPEEYGAVGDGSTDDSTAFQVFLTAAQTTNLKLKLNPTKTYRIATPLTYVGTTTASFVVEGGVQSPVGLQGSRLVYDGTAGGTLFHGSGMWGCCFRNVIFDGNDKAQKLVHIDGQLSGSLAASAHNTIQGCSFFRLQQSGTPEAVVAGSSGGAQSSELRVQDCYFRGTESALTTHLGHGVATFGAANVKNLFVEGCEFYHLNIGIYNVGSGSDISTVQGCYFGDVNVAVSVGNQTTIVFGCGQETQSITSSRFVVGGTTSTPTSCTIQNCYSVIKCPTDDYGIQVVGGHLELVGNDLRNNRTSTSVYKVQSVAGIRVKADASAASRGSVSSRGNWYGNVVPTTNATVAYAPIYDTSNNHLLEDEFGARGGGALIESWGDIGYPVDGLTNPYHLETCRGTPQEVRMNAYSSQVGFGRFVRGGQCRRANQVIDMDVGDMLALGSSPTGNLQVGKLYQRWAAMRVYMEVLTPFAGPSLTAATVALGPGSGPSTFLLLASSVTASAGTTYGKVDADLGTLLSRSAAIQGGYLASTTADTVLSALITTTGCNINALTAGRVRFYLTTEAID
jgi:hypothetical protein